MKFESNRAWEDAVQLVSTNREVLAVLAGIFFLLPGLVMSFFFADTQTAIMADPMNAAENLGSELNSFVATALTLGLLQLAGYMALLALLTDRTRPTVGEAIATGFKSLPSLIGAVLIFLVGYLLSVVVFGTIGGLLGMIGALRALIVVGTALSLFAICYVMTRLSQTVAAIVIERSLNPFTALRRSWQLTKGNGMRLFGFYLLLAIAYMVIAIVMYLAVSALFAVAGKLDKTGFMVMALVTGVIGAGFNALFTAIIAAIHRQLAGPSA